VGWKQIVATIFNDLGEDITIDHHHLIAEGLLYASAPTRSPILRSRGVIGRQDGSVPVPLARWSVDLVVDEHH
jgi:hypothetical protein